MGPPRTYPKGTLEMPSRRTLSDTYIRARKPAPHGKRDETPDLLCPRLWLRVTDKGHRSFVYLARFPGSNNPTRRKLGDHPVMTLQQAREKARAWDALIAQGIDPAVDE